MKRILYWYALSGFIALSLEILWFRVMDVAVKSMAFTFGSVLCFYLLGLGLGSLIGGRLAPRWNDSLGRREAPARGHHG